MINLLKIKKGFVLIELVIATAIVAILTAVAVPSVISIKRSLDFQQVNDYAQSVYMAAESNMVKNKIGSNYKTLSQELISSNKVDTQYLPTGMENYEYYFVTNEDSLFDTILPENSIDATVRNLNLLIEYDPYNLEIYSVFCYEKEPLDYSIIVRDEETRRDICLGYYVADIQTIDGTNKPTEKDKYTVNLTEDSTLVFETNYGEDYDGALIITLPLPKTETLSTLGYSSFLDGLTIDLELYNTQGNKLSIDLNNNDRVKLERRADNIIYTYIIDSVRYTDRAAAEIANWITGDNIQASIDVKFDSDKYDVEITNSHHQLQFNPLFDNITNGVISISNGRHLQNLNNYHGSAGIEAQLTSNITWLNHLAFNPIYSTIPLVGNNQTIYNLSSCLYNHLTYNLSNLTLTNSTITNSGVLANSCENITLNNITITNCNISSNEEVVGGLVGTATNSVFSNISVDGVITSNGTYTGGAIGYDSAGNTYTDIIADVDISSNSYGKFIGYVKDGVFTNCQGLGDGNGQFLQTIYEETTTKTSTNNIYLTYDDTIPGGRITTNPFTITKYFAKLNNCIYTNGSTNMQQIISDAKYYEGIVNNNIAKSEGGLEVNSTYLFISMSGKALVNNNGKAELVDVSAYLDSNGNVRADCLDILQDLNACWTYTGQGYYKSGNSYYGTVKSGFLRSNSDNRNLLFDESEGVWLTKDIDDGTMASYIDIYWDVLPIVQSDGSTKYTLAQFYHGWVGMRDIFGTNCIQDNNGKIKVAVAENYVSTFEYYNNIDENYYELPQDDTIYFNVYNASSITSSQSESYQFLADHQILESKNIE